MKEISGPLDYGFTDCRSKEQKEDYQQIYLSFFHGVILA